jgi:hypothetical protein
LRWANCLFLPEATVSTSPVESKEVAPGVVVDYSAADQLVGIELLHLSKRTPKLDLRDVEVQTF